MEVNKEWLASCGLYCGVCGVLMATRDNNTKFKEKLSTVYGVAPEDIECRGCHSDVRFKLCNACLIKTCVLEKNYQSCADCDQFPCKFIDNFPIAVGKSVILRTIPAWRALGTEKWVEEEEKRYICPHCNAPLFRGAKRCRACKESVSVDF